MLLKNILKYLFLISFYFGKKRIDNLEILCKMYCKKSIPMKKKLKIMKI